jgi:uncharacterized sulfatase
MNKKTNVLFITTDQQQKKTLGTYGNELIMTPNLDKLANTGIVLERAYCENPLCIPSRNTMITGRKSLHHRASQHNSSLPDNEKCLGDILKNNGYRTHFIGKPHFKSQQTHGTEESIEDWRNGLYDDWNGPYVGFETIDMILGHSNPLEGHYGKWMKTNHPDKIRYFSEENIEQADVTCGQGVFLTNIPEEVHSSTYIGNQTIEFLKNAAESDSPFYCFSSFPDPHWPIMTPLEFYTMYKDLSIDTAYSPLEDDPNIKNYPSIIKEYFKTGRFLDYDGGGHTVNDKKDIEIITKAYWGAITLIDKNIGRILSTLEDLGLKENTLIIFTADHGEYMGAHGMMAKGGMCWEEYINVPFIASYPPYIQRQSRSSDLFSFTDIVPTILDILELEKPGNLPSMPYDGISQKEMFFGKKNRVRKALTVHHTASNLKETSTDQHVLIRDDGWKLIYFANDLGGQLYNLTKDPKEEKNLYNLQEFSVVQKEMEYELLDMLISECDKDPIIQNLTSDPKYSSHVMKKEIWEKDLAPYM